MEHLHSEPDEIIESMMLSFRHRFDWVLRQEIAQVSVSTAGTPNRVAAIRKLTIRANALVEKAIKAIEA